ncbi:LPS export ABC transporter permease LptG [Parvibium lacunae]|uniref:LPS export ABC transporter permease LptG n=1 Tax=Parvibium lacunae TaxID=1888893 RepID=A0A368KYE0_9BURK|nr:LPS export ABC transporter permease LptG [Parvibium lacunae]RCS56463.1 LPS export ABC transporter permease LptG [Parvibium lacunae]
MRLLHQYIGTQLRTAIAFVALTFLALFSFFDLVSELGDVGKGQYRFQHAVMVVALNIPGHLYELLPIAGLIGAIYVFARLANQSEFTIMRAAGMGTATIIVSIWRHGTLLLLLTFLCGEVLTPPAAKYAENLRAQMTGQNFAEEFRSGIWLRDNLPVAQNGTAPLAAETRFVNVSEVRADNQIRQIRIFSFDKDFRLHEILEAATGTYLAEGVWALTQVRRTRFLLNARGEPNRTELTQVETLSWPSTLTPTLLSAVLVRPNNMAAFNLYQYIQHLRDNQQKTHRFEIAFWRKISYPFAVYVMLMLALPFAYLHFRTGGISLKIFIGVMLGVSFNLLNNLFSHIGLLNTWSPVLSATLPSLMALLLAAIALYWVERH